MTELHAIGLISFDTTPGFKISDLPQEITTSYHGDSVDLLIVADDQERDHMFDAGHVMLTQVGTELATVCNPRPIDGFKDYVLDRWKKLGYTIVSDDQNTTTD